MIHFEHLLHPTHVASSYIPPYARSKRNGANSFSMVGVAQTCTVLSISTAKDRPHGENSQDVTLPLKFM